MTNRERFGFVICLFCAALLSGCAFDLGHIKFDAAQLQSGLSETRNFTLEKDLALNGLPCGYHRTLKKDKKWTLIGMFDKGEVFKPIGHSFTVECSNVFEAYLVLQENRLCGFYLPVEKGFVKMEKPITLPIKAEN